MSSCTRARKPANSSVTVPTTATVFITASDWAKIGYSRATKNTPAVTIVAAWISAETGVGPAIASGSHTCSGICPDLPTAPRKIIRQPSTIVPWLSCPAVASSIVRGMLNGLAAPAAPITPADSTITPTIRPMSANLVVRNALLAQSWLCLSSQ